MLRKGTMCYELNSAMFLSGHEKKTSIDWTTLRSPYRLGINTGEKVYIGTLDGTDLVMRANDQTSFQGTIS